MQHLNSSCAAHHDVAPHACHASQTADSPPFARAGNCNVAVCDRIWVADLAAYIAANLPTMRAHLKHVQHAKPEYQYRYLLNQARSPTTRT